ncbi:hypothetical protein THIOM_002866 [Candidatus Thiomargarita nelsonii]|uniref:Uncharacterized protein n=1 Tax=Candidatus Thiomargarita nelsonii TaxID=1003181 RepID=A0A176S0A7_9GAMM|nr:hypothetical protein THIOM_002866 [Candidatus Thiomargarita nelsonii]
MVPNSFTISVVLGRWILETSELRGEIPRLFHSYHRHKEHQSQPFGLTSEENVFARCLMCKNIFL